MTMCTGLSTLSLYRKKPFKPAQNLSTILRQQYSPHIFLFELYFFHIKLMQLPTSEYDRLRSTNQVNPSTEHGGYCFCFNKDFLLCLIPSSTEEKTSRH